MTIPTHPGTDRAGEILDQVIKFRDYHAIGINARWTGDTKAEFVAEQQRLREMVTALAAECERMRAVVAAAVKQSIARKQLAWTADIVGVKRAVAEFDAAVDAYRVATPAATSEEGMSECAPDAALLGAIRIHGSYCSIVTSRRVREMDQTVIAEAEADRERQFIRVQQLLKSALAAVGAPSEEDRP